MEKQDKDNTRRWEKKVKDVGDSGRGRKLRDFAFLRCYSRCVRVETYEPSEKAQRESPSLLFIANTSLKASTALPGYVYS